MHLEPELKSNLVFGMTEKTNYKIWSEWTEIQFEMRFFRKSCFECWNVYVYKCNSAHIWMCMHAYGW